MSPDDILEYASHAVGFKVAPGRKIVVNEECYGICLMNQEGYKSEKGALGIIENVAIKPNPAQLTIEVSILVDEDRGVYIVDTFDQDGVLPHFPFSQTQEDIELDRAEKAAKAEADKIEKEAKAAAAKADPKVSDREAAAKAANPDGSYREIMRMPAADAPESEWRAYRNSATYARRRQAMQNYINRSSGKPYPAANAPEHEWEAYFASMGV